MIKIADEPLKPSKSEMESLLGYDLEQWQYDGAEWCIICEVWSHLFSDDAYDVSCLCA